MKTIFNVETKKNEGTQIVNHRGGINDEQQQYDHKIVEEAKSPHQKIEVNQMGGTSGELTSSQKQHARYELIIKRSPKLEISVVESQALPQGHLVTLNALGVES